MSFGHYRRFSGREKAGDVLRELLERPCPFLVVGGSHAKQSAFRIEGSLLRSMARSPDEPLASVLLSWSSRGFGMKAGGPKATALAPLVSPDGTAVAVGGDFASVTHALYPRLDPSSESVAPADILDVTVSLSDRLYGMSGTSIDVVFTPDLREVTLTAVVTRSRGFVPAEGQSWSAEMKVGLDAGGKLVLPPPWTFQALAVASETYELTVTFSSGAASVGSVTRKVGKQGVDDAGTFVSAVPIEVRAPRRGRTMALLLYDHELFYRLYDDGKDTGIAGHWPEYTPTFLLTACNTLELAADLAEVREQGKVLWGQIPRAIQDWLCETAGTDVPLTILSHTPLLPFEALVLARGGKDTFLGVDRQVVRWVPDFMEPAVSRLDVTEAACIRPVPAATPPADPDAAAAAALRADAAAAEDATLDRRLGAHQHVGTARALRDLLRNGNTPLVHYYGGHAQGYPEAGFVMDTGVFGPVEVVGQPLLDRARPFVFINACQAARAIPGELTVRTNFPKTLISENATGVVASLLSIDAAVAPKAAEVFYDAVGRGLTVGEALRLTREQALHVADPAHARSFMSYLAWASPDLHLDLHPKAAAATSSAVG